MTISAPERARFLLWLTGSRLVIGPALAIYLVWAQSAAQRAAPDFAAVTFGAAAIVFLLAAATDWLDGYLARRWNAVTPLGAALDHAADKALVAPVLVALTLDVLPNDLAIAAAIIVARDMAIAGLREGLSHSGVALPVSWMGKVKAWAEMAGVTLVLILPVALFLAPAVTPLLELGARAMLWAAAALAVFSAAQYLRTMFTKM